MLLFKTFSHHLQPADGLALSALNLLPSWRATRLRGGSLVTREPKRIKTLSVGSVHRYRRARSSAERWTSGLSPTCTLAEMSPRQILALRCARRRASSFTRWVGESFLIISIPFSHLDQHPLREQFAFSPGAKTEMDCALGRWAGGYPWWMRVCDSCGKPVGCIIECRCGRVFLSQRSADRLASRCRVVLGYAVRCRPS